MAILAIDTCLQFCSAAIVDGSTVLATEAIPLQKGHAEALAPLVARLLKAASMTIPGLARIGVTIGPGSFTGVRVGLAFARGLSIGHAPPVPLIGITTLEALASQTPSRAPKIILLDARRGQVYGQIFTPPPNGMANPHPVIPPFIASYEVARSIISDHANPEEASLIGSGIACIYPDKASLFEDQINPVALAKLAAEKPLTHQPPEALYLRAADAKPAKALFPQS